MRIVQFSGKYKKRICVAFVFSFFKAMLSKMPIFYAMLVLNRLHEGTFSSAYAGKIAGMLVGTIAIQVCCGHLSDRLQSGAGYLLFADKRIALGNQLRQLPMGYFTEGNIGKISSVLSSDMLFVEENSMAKIADVMSYVFSSAIMTIFLFSMHWKLGCIGLAIDLVAIGIAQFMNQHSKREAHERQEQNEALTDAVLSFVEGIGVIKSYNLLGEKSTELQENFRKSRDKSIRFEKQVIPWMMALSVVYAIGTACILYIGLQLYLSKTMDLFYAFGLVLFIMELFAPLKVLFAESNNLAIMDKCLDRIDEVMNEVVLADKGTAILPKEYKDYEVAYEHVTFAYEEKDVLHDISFNMQPNTMTALVGLSGSGKSTIASLLPRFWDVKSGSIKVRGVDVRQLPLATLLDQISMVFQRVYLFQDTIYNNIIMGRPDATYEEVMEAAKKARCYDFIMALPEGFETMVGEGGASLSGGEKQRISIARCILKDAPIVILDEATASVDADNESYIQEAISELVKGKSLLVIAHRLQTICDAEQILVMKDGQIVERGTHNALLEQNQLYKLLWEEGHSKYEWVL